MLKIGLLKEIKPFEGRVMLTPKGVKVLVKNGIDVFVEHDAGEACRYDDIQYQQAGATILPTMEKVFQKAQLILQVQAPQPIEFELLNKSHLFLSFLNLYQFPDRLQALLDTKSVFVSAQLLQSEDRQYPLLMGMSEIAGNMAVFQAANLLSIPAGGKGKLLSGANSVKPAVVTIVGAGKVGRTAAKTAAATGALVNLLCLKPGKVDHLKEEMAGICVHKYSDQTLKELLPDTDVLMVAVYSLKNEYDLFISRDMVRLMEPGSVLIDISVEQAKVVETSHITSHDQPTFVMDGVVHYCVPNIAGMVPLTASRTLTKRLLPYLKILAQKGLKGAMVGEPGLISALSIYKGKLTNRNYADFYNKEFYNIFELLELNL